MEKYTEEEFANMYFIINPALTKILQNIPHSKIHDTIYERIRPMHAVRPVGTIELGWMLTNYITVPKKILDKLK